MKTIYKAVRAKLKTDISDFKWIDEDFGQLNTSSGQRPAFIGIKICDCKDITDKSQSCKGTVTVRMAFDPLMKNTNSKVDNETLDKSLSPYDTIAKVYACLQGFETESFNALSRRNQGDEKRSDGLFVYTISFAVEFEDNTAE